LIEADSVAVIAASMAAEASMAVAAAGSMVAVDSMEVAAATAAGTAKILVPGLKDRDGWQHPCQPFFVFRVVESWNSLSYCTGREPAHENC
jgi:hypothetical protein